MQTEIWKDIPGYEGLYKVSNIGNVKSFNQNPKKPIILKFGEKKGYPAINLYGKNKIIKCYCVHRLVALAFIPKKKNKAQINHIDGNKTNNRVDNLEWCDVSENQNHAYKIGIKKAVNGSSVGTSKLKERDVIEIRKLIKSGKTLTYISRLYNVHHSTISYIKSGRIWKHL